MNESNRINLARNLNFDWFRHRNDGWMDEFIRLIDSYHHHQTHRAKRSRPRGERAGENVSHQSVVSPEARMRWELVRWLRGFAGLRQLDSSVEALETRSYSIFFQPYHTHCTKRRSIHETTTPATSSWFPQLRLSSSLPSSSTVLPNCCCCRFGV
jgi:hypothetical protein